MAILKTTVVNGNLFVTGSENYVSASEFRGPLEGTASWAVTASHALNALSASALDPAADLQVNTLHVSGNAQVDGDLKVLGDLTYVGVQDLRVKDHVIELNVDESGSAQGSANGAGVIIRNSDAAGDVELIYSSSDDKLHVNKTIAGTIDSASEAAHAVSASRADSAAQADKVAFKLSFGSGISSSVSEYDGHEAVTIDVDTAAIERTVVSQSISASVAEIAEEVRQHLIYTITGSDGSVVSGSYNGAEEKSFTIDLSPLETKADASASISDLQAQIDAISGDSTGSIDSKIEAKIAELDADASANASGTAVSGGVFVLSGVAFNEADGLLTSGSATSVEVDPAGAAAKAKDEAYASASAYADNKVSESVAALSSSVATDFSASAASQNALSSSLSASIAAVDAKANDGLDLVESSSYIAVSEKSNKKQTISAKTALVASASVENGDGLAVASDVKAYVDGKTSNAVSATGDSWVSASAANNAVTIVTNVKNVADATPESDGLAKASDVKSHVSSSVAALSQSVSASDAAQDVKISALESSASAAASAISELESSASAAAQAIEVLESASATYVTTASFNSYTSSANGRLDALETASATHVTTASFNSFTESTIRVFSQIGEELERIEASQSVLDDKYVAKAGDSMSGNLNMQTNAVQFGNMLVQWNATDQAIEFVTVE